MKTITTEEAKTVLEALEYALKYGQSYIAVIGGVLLSEKDTIAAAIRIMEAEDVSEKDERAKFEAWCYDKHPIGGPDRGLNEYANSGTQKFWQAWQARAALSAPAAPSAELLSVVNSCLAQGCTLPMEDWLDERMPAAAPAAVDGVDVQDAARWRMFERVLRNGHIPGAGHGRRFRIIETDPMYGNEKEFNDFIGAINDAICK